MMLIVVLLMLYVLSSVVVCCQILMSTLSSYKETLTDPIKDLKDFATKALASTICQVKFLIPGSCHSDASHCREVVLYTAVLEMDASHLLVALVIRASRQKLTMQVSRV